jgi:hypothetical protein
MENFNFIQWTDLETRSRGGHNKLNDFEISTYRNLHPKQSTNCGNYCTLSLFLSEVYEKDTHIRVGHINSKVVFQFNKEHGLNITGKKNVNKIKEDTTSRRIVSKDFIDVIYKSFNIKPEKNNYKFKLVDLGNNTFLIDSII